jgi:hypothetical protein
LGQIARDQLVRQLGQDACAVAGPAIGRHRAAMGMVAQSLQRQLQHTMAAPAAALNDKAGAAGVVFEGWIVQGAGLLARLAKASVHAVLLTRSARR